MRAHPVKGTGHSSQRIRWDTGREKSVWLHCWCLGPLARADPEEYAGAASCGWEWGENLRQWRTTKGFPAREGKYLDVCFLKNITTAGCRNGLGKRADVRERS